MKPLALSPAALADLDRIADHISTDDPEGALTYIAALEARALVAADRPFTLPGRDYISPGLRSIRHQSHLIFFRVLPEEVRVVRIVHVKRDFNAIDFDSR